MNLTSTEMCQKRLDLQGHGSTFKYIRRYFRSTLIQKVMKSLAVNLNMHPIE